MAIPEERLFICRSCVAGCGLIAHIEGGRVLRVSGDRADPVARGYSCAKGRAIPTRHEQAGRLSVPSIRGRETNWEDCLNDIAGGFKRLLAKSGPDSIAHYAGMGLYVDALGWWSLERLFDAIGSAQRYTTYTVDMSSVLRACELVIGFPFLPHWTPEDADTRLAILIGTNPSVSHGHTIGFANPTARLRDFRARGGELWVIDPRATKTAAMANRHIAPRPDSDGFVLAWLIREILRYGADEKELATACTPADVQALRDAVEPFTLDAVAAAADVPAEDLIELLGAIRRHKRLAILGGTGVSFAPNGFVTDWLRLALLIVTGSLDRAGGMRFNPGGAMRMEAIKWRGHASADGAAPPGPRSRPELRQVVGQRPSAALVDEIEAGEIRALILAGANPLGALPQPERLRAALARLDLLVLVDCFDTELTALATHVLPSAWQLERANISLLGDRSHYAPAVLPVAGERRQSWWMFAQIGDRIGRPLFDEPVADEEDIFRRFTAHARDGLDALRAAGSHGVAAPVLYGWVRDKVLEEGRWRLVPGPMPALLAKAWAEQSGEPRLVSGRRMNSNNSVHYAGAEAGGPPAIAISADLAEAGAISDGATLRICTAAGELIGRAALDPSLRQGVVWVNHGWLDQNVNQLVDGDAIEPLHGQPAQSGIPVRLERIKIDVRRGADN
ncbi:Formate dehydrogenase [Sphingobium herbicidovorans NBRC 16415]|uniref:Formate dehydrogenase n=1 Tax=Sphingobium herbicidovorans (strain ATCC 700291 / DSM 11019 / CCUG 56400 / KCTC 2939 / LMG 18315 / NBRC 16415 / MH) TaxID=1219045 RepID=A0A086PA89_SPHHM|nr:molybdopterin-dependent oxidoreductase [Sphingobium herbicidovorans]KFG90307.1 Formate dehydrogenase [Sphingobium herbicidovorans NBRC 16415]